MGSIERFLALAGLAWFSSSAPARAEPLGANETKAREQCLEHHEQAQAARLAGDLLVARRALRECAATACPGLVSRDCLDWLMEVEEQIPSVIFRATKDGEDLEQVRISEGDRQLADALTGTPLDLEPGPHHFTAELAGFPPQQATYVLQAGDKARVVRFDFVTPKPPAPAAASAKAAPAPPAPAKERPIPKLTYVLAGGALTAAVVGGIFGALALSERSELEQGCAPLCSEHDERRLTQLALAADISFALAVLAAGGATYSFLTRPSVAATPQALGAFRLRLGSGVWTVNAEGSF